MIGQQSEPPRVTVILDSPGKLAEAQAECNNFLSGKMFTVTWLSGPTPEIYVGQRLHPKYGVQVLNDNGRMTVRINLENGDLAEAYLNINAIKIYQNRLIIEDFTSDKVWVELVLV